MDATRFETLARTLTQTRSRRAAMCRLLAGTLGLFGLTQAEAKNKGKGRKKKKGCGKGKRQCGTTCIPTSQCCPFALSGQFECDPCTRETCNNGVCGCAPATINHHGVCGSFLNCLSVGEICTNNLDCCSEQCNVPSDNGTMRCNRGTENCLTDFDCVSGLCRGFLCPELYRALTSSVC